MEDFFIRLFHILKLFCGVVLEVLVCTTSARFVCLVPFGRPFHHLFDSVLNYSPLKRLHAKYKAENFFEFLTWIREHILKAEEVDRLVGSLSLADPVGVPLVVRVRCPALKVKPIWADRVLSQYVGEVKPLSHCEHLVE